MLVVTWIATGLLAIVFFVSGAMKLGRSKQQLASSGLKWTEDFTAGTVKLIGAAEVVGAVGIAVGGLVPALHWGAVVAAVGLGVLMLGAIVVHTRRRELSMVVVNVVLLVLAAVAAVGWTLT